MKTLKISASLFMVIAIILCSFAPVYALSQSSSNASKTVLAERLISKLESANDSDVIEVVVWIKDVDDEAVEQRLKKKPD